MKRLRVVKIVTPQTLTGKQNDLNQILMLIGAHLNWYVLHLILHVNT